MNPADCPHGVLAGEGESRHCATCAAPLPKRTVAEHLAAMRAVIRDAKDAKGPNR